MISFIEKFCHDRGFDNVKYDWKGLGGDQRMPIIYLFEFQTGLDSCYTPKISKINDF